MPIDYEKFAPSRPLNDNERKAQKGFIFAIINKLGWTTDERHEKQRQLFGVESFKDISQNDAMLRAYSAYVNHVDQLEIARTRAQTRTGLKV